MVWNWLKFMDKKQKLKLSIKLFSITSCSDLLRFCFDSQTIAESLTVNEQAQIALNKVIRRNFNNNFHAYHFFFGEIGEEIVRRSMSYSVWDNNKLGKFHQDKSNKSILMWCAVADNLKHSVCVCSVENIKLETHNGGTGEQRFIRNKQMSISKSFTWTRERVGASPFIVLHTIAQPSPNK